MIKATPFRSLLFGVAAIAALIPAESYAQNSATPAQQAVEKLLGQKILHLECGLDRAVVDLENNKRLIIGNNKGDDHMWGYLTVGHVDPGEVWKREFSFVQAKKDGPWSPELKPKKAMSQAIQDNWTETASKVIRVLTFDQPQPLRTPTIDKPACILRGSQLDKIAVH